MQRALKNCVESRNYRNHELRDLMEYRNATNCELLSQDQTKLIQSDIIAYILQLKNRALRYN